VKQTARIHAGAGPVVLTRSQVKSFYDRFGRRQDSQSFYEDRAFDELIAHGEFERARSVFELGCGTGRLARRLLEEHLPLSSSYFGIDLSQTMTAIAAGRIAPYADRARVEHADGVVRFPVPDQSVDRVVSTYVLDLLSEEDIERVLAEAHRVLAPDGRICLVSLTKGVALASKMICGLWSALFRVHGSLVGGCRPIRLEPLIDRERWSMEHHRVLTQFGVSSETVIARPRELGDKAADAATAPAERPDPATGES